MSCKKSELVNAINSFAAAGTTNNANLISMSARALEDLVETLEFSPEEETPVSETEVVKKIAS